jgi:predicted MFS family arabinose efflux permease
MTDEASVEPGPKKKLSLKQRLTKLMDQYGKVALYTYLTLSLSAIAGFSIAIGFGMEANSTGGVLGAIGAGWLAAKATMPLRILATLGLTPLIAAFLARRRKARGIVDEDEDDEDDLDEDAPAA